MRPVDSQRNDQKNSSIVPKKFHGKHFGAIGGAKKRMASYFRWLETGGDARNNGAIALKSVIARGGGAMNQGGQDQRLSAQDGEAARNPMSWLPSAPARPCRQSGKEVRRGGNWLSRQPE